MVLYTNGDSTVPVKKRWIFEKEDWPVSSAVEASLKGLTHSSWAIQDASKEADVIHLNDAPGLTFSRFVEQPFVYTVHHVFDPVFGNFYKTLPENIHYVTISDFQRRKLAMPRTRTIHHGVDFTSSCHGSEKRGQYLVFLGRVAPPKGTHLAIEIAKQAGVPLKIAGEIQPLYQDYWETKVKPHVDGKLIEYVGSVGREDKNELLANAMAMLFPIQWDEPFGLVLIESMACGTPVLAMPGGSVEEIVKEGVSGHIRRTVEELAGCVKNLKLDPKTVRDYAQQKFSTERMVADYLQLYSEIISQHESEESPERVVA